jgi:hypothetical protein
MNYNFNKVEISNGFGSFFLLSLYFSPSFGGGLGGGWHTEQQFLKSCEEPLNICKSL